MERHARTLLIAVLIAVQGCAAGNPSREDEHPHRAVETLPAPRAATAAGGADANVAAAPAASRDTDAARAGGSGVARETVRLSRGEPSGPALDGASGAPRPVPLGSATGSMELSSTAPRAAAAPRPAARAPAARAKPIAAAPAPTAMASMSATFEPGEAARTPAGSAPDTRAASAEPELIVDAGKKPKYRIVRVFFASDRNTTDDRRPDRVFGTGRSNLKYGTVAVSIPREHRLGEIERPKLIRLELRENPEKHMALMNVSILDKDPFFALLARRIKATAGRSSFVFVHGYNVSFADAARRTAQMHYDLDFDGAPIFYSWPSQASTAKYTFDEANIEWSESNMLYFLRDLLARAETESVYLVAHSMGNRGLTNAIATLVEREPLAARKIKEIILAAPDIDADVFKRDIAPALARSGAGVTLYASSADRALIASRTVHGSPRAGDSGRSRVIASGVETIDASEIDTSWLGHSYYAEAQPLIADMFNLVKNRQRAAQRFGLLRETDSGGSYWRFRR